MTAVADRDTHAPFLPSLLQMSRRNIVRMTRVPSILVPMMVMPVFFVIAFTGSFDGISRVEGFPTPKLINWVAAFALLQGASFAGVGTAGSVAQDLDNGFVDRLLVSPIHRSAILLAPLVYTAVRAVIPIGMVVSVAMLSGADLPGGALGLLLVFVGGVGGSLVIGCFALAVVLRMGDIRAMTIVQMSAFLLLFPSIGQVPLDLLEGWMEAVARVNPATNLLRMIRQGFLGPVTWADTWPGLLVLVGGYAVFYPWARYELQRRTP